MDEENELRKRVEHLENSIEVVKKRIDYIFEVVRPFIQREECRFKHADVDDNGRVIPCFNNHSCSDCCYRVNPDARFEITEKGKEYLSSH